MRETKLLRPRYAEDFRCIGPACEDTCCSGWAVYIDRQTYDKYQALPPSPLRILLDTHVQRTSETSNPDAPFATIQMSPSGACPMHNADKLCQIQAEKGASYLSHTCSTFPRRDDIVDSLKETTLSLSCPEAARLVLSSTQRLTSSGGRKCMVWEEHPPAPLPLISYFWPIREFIVDLLRNRDYLLWQRLFLLGSFCRRLEAVAHGQVEGGFPALESAFSAAIAAGSLRDSIDTIPPNHTLQLDLVLQLANSPLVSRITSPRLVECLNAFRSGVGQDRSSNLVEQAAEYATAYDRFYAPFFAQHPHILENLLVNRILRSKLPLAPQFVQSTDAPEPARQFALLAVEFALIKGLLIGVAGHHREAFCIDHVVHTVQVVSKHFEHNILFVSHALELLAARGLDNPHGHTMLLRN